MALFASGLYSLAGMVADKSADANTTSWHALRVFTYSSIVLNLSGAVFSLVITKMCSDVPLAAMQTLLSENNKHTPQATKDDPKWINKGSDGIPFAIADQGTLEATILEDHYTLLESFGMSSTYKWVIRINSGVLVVACVCTFTALSLWTFLNETLITAGVTMIVFGSTAILVASVFIMGNRGQGWR
jgi:hypothetical protein